MTGPRSEPRTSSSDPTCRSDGSTRSCSATPSTVPRSCNAAPGSAGRLRDLFGASQPRGSVPTSAAECSDRFAARDRRLPGGREDALASGRRDRGGGIEKVGVVVDGQLRLTRPADPNAARCRRPFTALKPCPQATRRDARLQHRHGAQRHAHDPGLGHRRRRQRDALGSRDRHDAQRLAAQRPRRQPLRAALRLAALQARQGAPVGRRAVRLRALRRGAADRRGRQADRRGDARDQEPGAAARSALQAPPAARPRATTGASRTASPAAPAAPCASSTRPTPSTRRPSRPPRSASASKPASSSASSRGTSATANASASSAASRAAPPARAPA